LRTIKLQQIVERGLSLGAKSIYLFPGFPPLGNMHEVVRIADESLRREDVEAVLKQTTSDWQYSRFWDEKELDYSFGLGERYRLRVNAFIRRGIPSLVVRPLPPGIPFLETLNVPVSVRKLTGESNGLILVSGPTGSGKSTTIAALLNAINRERGCHIVTIEDVIEHVHESERAIISQREVGRDTRSVREALKRVLREDPDVIAVSDIRDGETMKAVLELADTGRVVISAIHTGNAIETISRIVDFFPEHEKAQVRGQMARVLRAIVAQRRLQRADGRGFLCAYEVFLNNFAMKTLIRENKFHQIPGVMESSGKEGMVSMDAALLDLYRQGSVSVLEVMRIFSGEKEFLKRIALEEAPEGADVSSGRRFARVGREAIQYCADCDLPNLAYFDASGMLFSIPGGLLFRTSGPRREDLHFIIDYTILSGKADDFPLRSLFTLSYKIVEVILEKHLYYLKLRVMTADREIIDLPNEFAKLTGDGKWHALALSIPQTYRGKVVKYYMLLFDDGIREILFSQISFA
jgi:twitching motility protein PilT